jgi:HEAT repeat protein
MRFVALYFVSAALVFAPLAAEPGNTQEKVGKGDGKWDADKVFDFLAKGRETLNSAELSASMRISLVEYAKANKLDPAKINRQQFLAFMEARTSVGIAPGLPKSTGAPSDFSEEVLRAAGLRSDGEALLAYFQQRTRTKVELEETLLLARQLGASDADMRAKSVSQILAYGPWAIPALYHVLHEPDNPLAVKRARHCLEWLEGKRSTEVPIAAAKVLAQRKPEAAAAVLLAFLPLADNAEVVDGVKAALSDIAAKPGKSDAALLAALRDPLPLRRAIAVEVLAVSGKPDALPETRKLLADSKAQVQLRAAVALTRQLDESAIEVLIDLLAKLPAAERSQAEAALRQLAGEWAPNPPSAGDHELSRKIRRDVWSAWWRAVDGPSLLAVFRQRTLTKEEAATAQSLIEQLSDKAFGKRELASAALIAQGTKVVGLLRAAKSPSLDHAKRVEACLKAITESEARDKLPLSAPYLLAARKPAGAADALLGYLPFTDDQAMTGAIIKSLTSLQRSQSEVDPAIIKALSNPVSVRRIAAAGALVGAGGAAHPAVRKLLTDADPQVRLSVAVALVHAKEKEAVPALIKLVGELPAAQAKDADDLLRRLAGVKAPPQPAGNDAAARIALRVAWDGWWKEHGATVNLAVLEKGAVRSDLVVVAELGPKGGKAVPAKKGGFGGAGGVPIGGGKKADPPAKGANPTPAGSDRLIGIDRNGQVSWQIQGLAHPIDFQVLANDRVLIAEYTAKRVTERDLQGNILWEVANLPNAPMNVQRLANGNTFIALYGTAAATGGYSLLEVDRQGKTVFAINGVGGAANRGKIGSTNGNPRGAVKLVDGQTVCLASRVCLRLDATGKETMSFPLPSLAGTVTSLVGNIDVTPKGNILVAHSDNTVVEYDPNGKIAWKANVVGNRAIRLSNGNTLVASETSGVIELDPAGRSVWHYQPPAGYQAVRARQAGEGTGQGNPR